MSDSRFWVRRYLGEGWSVIQIPKGEKGPRVPNWQNTTFTEADFGEDDNIGVRLGEPSGNLIDIDLDAPEAVAARGQRPARAPGVPAGSSTICAARPSATSFARACLKKSQ